MAHDAGTGRGARCDDLVGRSNDIEDEADQIGPEIKHWSTRQVRSMNAMAGGEPLTEIGHDRSDVADSVGVEKLAEDVELRQERGPVRLHAEQTAAVGLHWRSVIALVRVEGKRLLDQRVFARLQRQQRVGEMCVVGGRDVHDVDVRVGHEVLIAAVGPFDAESPSELGCAVDAA